jgi:hypothetical protein
MERLESQTNSDKSQRYKTIQKLPKNFFEQILELELKLKREFSLEHLQEIIQLYSV